MTAFFDTNVLVYSLSPDRKGARAQELTQRGGWISVQVLNEATRVLRGKLRYDWPIVGAALADFQAMLEVLPVDIEIHQVGLRMAQVHNFAVFDAMIVAAALQSGCDTLYSEDMHHGMRIDDRLTILNPFRA